MLGSINKLLRNVASLKGKSAFDKCLIKATFSGDVKEPKEKHVIFVLECMKGKHLELIRPKDALSKLFDRFFNNLGSFSLTIKSLVILHRALQEEEISQMVAHRIKEKENLLYPFQNEEQTQDSKMQCFICELYISYIKSLINFIIICQLFSISLKDLHHYTKNLQHQELFLIFSRIDLLIESILKVFEQKQYCQTYRLLQSVIYLVFVDLLQIYQSYYLLITVMLEKFDEMSLKDAKRAFIIYLNFIKINKEIRKMASSIIQEFNVKIDISFYDIDTKVIEALKLQIESKEKEKLQLKQGAMHPLSHRDIRHSQLGGQVDGQEHQQVVRDENLFGPLIPAKESDGLTKKSSPRQARRKSAYEGQILRKKDANTDQKAKSRGVLADELQGGQGMQRKIFGNSPIEEEEESKFVGQYSSPQKLPLQIAHYQKSKTIQNKMENKESSSSQDSSFERDDNQSLTRHDNQQQPPAQQYDLQMRSKSSPLMNSSSAQQRQQNLPAVSSQLELKLHEMSIITEDEDPLGLLSDNDEERKQPSKLGRSQHQAVQGAKVKQSPQPILVKQDSQSPRARQKLSKVTFNEDLRELSQERKPKSNLDSDDLDEFKSIVVKDDQREDFFEALENSPPSYPFNRDDESRPNFSIQQVPFFNEDLDKVEKQDMNEANDIVEQSFQSCVGDYDYNYQ